MDADTLKRLAEAVLEMEKKATAGPWDQWKCRIAGEEIDEEFVYAHSGGTAVAEVLNAPFGDNARFIAHARTSAPQLARAVIALLPYVHHTPYDWAAGKGCEWAADIGEHCTCGFDAALKELGA